jgi:hypothetical protein
MGDQFEKSTNTSVIRRFTAFNNSTEYQTITATKRRYIMKVSPLRPGCSQSFPAAAVRQPGDDWLDQSFEHNPQVNAFVRTAARARSKNFDPEFCRRVERPISRLRVQIMMDLRGLDTR